MLIILDQDQTPKVIQHDQGSTREVLAGQTMMKEAGFFHVVFTVMGGAESG